jgi:hypothetical protein
MPFVATYQKTVPPNGVVWTIGTAATWHRADLPRGTTHLAVYPEADCYLFPQLLGDAGSSGPTGTTGGYFCPALTWSTVPVLALGAANVPSYGLTCDSATLAAAGGSFEVRLVPETDPIVAQLRSSSCGCGR